MSLLCDYGGLFALLLLLLLPVMQTGRWIEILVNLLIRSLIEYRVEFE